MNFNLRQITGKPLLKIIAYFIAGVFGMGITGGCFSSIKYDTYVSKDPGLGVVIKYVSGWSATEQHGSHGSFVQAVFLEPKGEDKTLKSAAMVITAQPADKVTLPAQTIDAFVDDLISKRMKFTDAKILSRSSAKVCGLAAADITLTYKSLDKIYSVDSQLVQYSERAVIFMNGGRFYTLRYENRAGAFPGFENAFSHVVQTLKFKK
jgi:hypothetical protein